MIFPFDTPREFQNEFMNDIRKCLDTKKHMISNAPTGFGKTAATIFTAIEYALANDKIIFFLTPRHSQHKIAVETVRKIKEKNSVAFDAVDLIGKKWLCNVEGVELMSSGDFSHFCRAFVKERKCQYYNATRDKVHEMNDSSRAFINEIRDATPYHAEELKTMASRFCPYEILTDLSKTSKIIIADYYHIFSSEKLLLKIGKKISDCIVIVDEAHNLPERIRALLSTRISTTSMENASNEAKQFGYMDLSGMLEDLEGIIKDMGKKMKVQEEFIEMNRLSDEISLKIRDINEFAAMLEEAGEVILKERKRSFVMNIGNFLASWTGPDDGYSRIISKGVNKRGVKYISISYNCLDPSMLAGSVLNGSYSSILMSGTLSPTSMYRDLLGLAPERTHEKTYKSPFPRSNRLNIIMNSVTTRYSMRSDEMYGKIATNVARCIHSIPGNVAVFFPSYKFRDIVYNFMAGKIQKEAILEQPEMSKEDKKNLFERFIKAAKKGSVLLGVQAGSFSEGVDFPGDFLNGVIVVGVPLDVPDLDTKAVIEYYDRKFRKGWDYGYLYPAMIKCIQSAGRCIRTEKDRGICVFMDERFAWQGYMKTFPPDMDIRITNDIESEAGRFFGA